MLDCSIRMALCCSALTIFDVRLLNRWRYYAPSAGRPWGSISALSIGLVLRSVGKKIDGNPKNIHGRFNRESRPPVERHGLPKGMVRLRSTGSFHQKNALIISAISTPRYGGFYRAR